MSKRENEILEAISGLLYISFALSFSFLCSVVGAKLLVFFAALLTWPQVAYGFLFCLLAILLASLLSNYRG